MAKTRIFMPEPYFGPCLLILHTQPDASLAAFDFHAIALWDAPTFKPWEVLSWCPDGTLDGWAEYPGPSPCQLALTQVLLARPQLISDQCWVCQQRYTTPHHIRFNLNTDPNTPLITPACPWDGSWPLIPWTPNQWPPAAAY